MTKDERTFQQLKARLAYAEQVDNVNRAYEIAHGNDGPDPITTCIGDPTGC